jgi:hypothetical protein
MKSLLLRGLRQRLGDGMIVNFRNRAALPAD